MRYIKQTLLMIFASMTLMACGDSKVDNIPASTGTISAYNSLVTISDTYTGVQLKMLPAVPTPDTPVLTAPGVFTTKFIIGTGINQETVTVNFNGTTGTATLSTKSYSNADGDTL